MRLFFIAFTLAMLAAIASTGRAANRTRPSTPPNAAAAPVPAGTYTLDKAHTSLIFHVNHLGFSRFTARFNKIDGQLQFDPVNPTASTVTATIDPRSLDLGDPPAGFHDTLTGKEFLDAAAFPQIIFHSTKVERTGTNAARVTGDLSLHGVTHRVVLQATFNGGYAGHPLDPHARIGFSAHGTFKRSDFGVAFGVPAPRTKMGVSDDVEVLIETEFNGPPLASAPSRK